VIYLDSSVLIAYYCPEPISTRAESIIRGKLPVFISDLTEVEAMSAVARKVRIGELTAQDAAKVRNHFIAHLNEGIYRRTSLGAHHIMRAREILGSFTTPLRTLDALHLAMATSEKFRLITADETFAQAARKFSIKTTFVTAR
jgi:predicted nucleic acid-binding protein